MEKRVVNQLKYHLFEPEDSKTNGMIVIHYHGWGVPVEASYDLGEALAANGFCAILPEIIYHDTRHPLKHPFNKEVMQSRFWEAIFKSIDEFDEFFAGLEQDQTKTFISGSSFGGFIANGIFAQQKNLAGLANVNGSGSYLLSERLFRQMESRHPMTHEEEKQIQRYDPIEKAIGHAPVLLMHGSLDSTVPKEGQEDYYRYLVEIKNKENVTLSIYNHINHQFSSEMLIDYMNWLKGHVID